MPRPIRHFLSGLQSRYGPRGALAVALAATALAVVPIPGLTLLPIGIAEFAKAHRARAA